MNDERRARSARGEATVAASLNAGGMMAELYLGRHIPGMPDWPALASAAIGALIVVALWVQRPNRSLASTLFVVNAIAVSAALFVRDPYYSVTLPTWVPFQANKLGCLIVALIAPSIPVGILAIGAHVGSSLLVLSVLEPSVRADIAHVEPMAALVFGLVGVVLLVYRIRAEHLERRLVREQAERAALQRFARSLLAVRELTNTPVQTIALSLDMIRMRADPSIEPIIDRMSRAVDQLGELSELLAQHDAGIQWEEDASESLDATAVLHPPAEEQRTSSR